MLRALLCVLGTTLALPVLAGGAEDSCDTALLLAIDVSNSVDDEEYRLQIDGLVLALRDPMVAEAMVAGQVAVAVMQWSGPADQRVSVPWRRIGEPADATLLAGTVRALPRAFIRSGTAPAEAIRRALALLAEAPSCGRHVIDVSGDGIRNEGAAVPPARDEAQAAGVMINGIAIEIWGTGVSEFFFSELITPGGFVMSASGHRDYARTLRAKILRELAARVG